MSKQHIEQWAVKQHLENNPKCEWLCTHSSQPNLGEVKQSEPNTELTIEEVYDEIGRDVLLGQNHGKRLLHALIALKVAEARIAQIETIVQRLNDLDDPNQHVSDTAMEIVMFDLHELKADKE